MKYIKILLKIIFDTKVKEIRSYFLEKAETSIATAPIIIPTTESQRK